MGIFKLLIAAYYDEPAGDVEIPGLANQFDSVHNRHTDVGNHNRRPVLLYFLEQFLPVMGKACKLQV